jgi:hypothetical protein
MSVFRDMTGPLLDEAERRLAELRGERQQAERRYELACVSLEKRVAEPPLPAPPAPLPPLQRMLSPRRIVGWAAIFTAATLIATMLF